MLEVAKAGARPEFLLQFFAGNELTRDFQQDEQDLDGLTGELQPDTVLAQFLRVRETSKGQTAQRSGDVTGLRHSSPQSATVYHLYPQEDSHTPHPAQSPTFAGNQ